MYKNENYNNLIIMFICMLCIETTAQHQRSWTNAYYSLLKLKQLKQIINKCFERVSKILQFYSNLTLHSLK